MKEAAVTYEYAIRELQPKHAPNTYSYGQVAPADMIIFTPVCGFPWSDHEKYFDINYLPATKEESFNSGWLGVSRIVDDNGDALTGWSHQAPTSYYYPIVLSAINPVKNNFLGLNDSQGTHLKTGDYVQYKNKEHEFQLGKVLSFTAGRVRTVKFPTLYEQDGLDKVSIINPLNIIKVANITDPVNDLKTYLYPHAH